MINTIISVAGKMAVGLVFTILLFFRPFVTGVFGFISGLCILGFIGTLILAREQTTALFGFFTFGLVAVGITFCYNWAVMLLAPNGFTMMMED